MFQLLDYHHMLYIYMYIAFFSYIGQCLHVGLFFVAVFYI
jgi:hypothetical protein